MGEDVLKAYSYVPGGGGSKFRGFIEYVFHGRPLRALT